MTGPEMLRFPFANGGLLDARRLIHAGLLIPAALLALNAGCASKEEMTSAAESEQQAAMSVPEVSRDYVRGIEAYSDGETEYAGFYNNFAFKATLLNSPVRELLITKQAEHYQWDNTKTQTEREKARQQMSSTTEAFISFYTPERKNDNLVETKSIWRVYLESGGRRYEGKVTRIRLLLAELQALYPYHTRWNTPYLASFPVPTTAIETQETKLTITGPLGTRTVTFKAAP